MILEILKYSLVCDVAAGSAEVASRPEGDPSNVCEVLGTPSERDAMSAL